MIRDFSNLNFESFQRLAEDESLSPYERIGFPDPYRQGFEEAIFSDIRGKLRLLDSTEKTVLDIGPGCSNLSHMLIQHCAGQGHRLLLADSKPMLAHLPDEDFINKIPGMFPYTTEQITAIAPEGIDIILCYSVLQYIFIDTNVYDAVNAMVGLLKSGGEILIGDIPNASMRKRFFSSSRGIDYHKKFTGTDTLPNTEKDEQEQRKIDDSTVLSIITSIRKMGVDAYILPQSPGLPMANRREDILVRKP